MNKYLRRDGSTGDKRKPPGAAVVRNASSGAQSDLDVMGGGPCESADLTRHHRQKPPRATSQNNSKQVRFDIKEGLKEMMKDSAEKFNAAQI